MRQWVPLSLLRPPIDPAIVMTIHPTSTFQPSASRASLQRFVLLVLLGIGLGSASAFAQDPPPAAPEADDADLEVEATKESLPTASPATTAPAEAPPEEASPAPAPAAAPPAAAPATPPPSPAVQPSARAPSLAAEGQPGAATGEPDQGSPVTLSTPEVGPAFTAPAGKDALPPQLEREGSNYRRPLRRGLSWWGFVQAQYQSSQLSEDQLDEDGHALNLDQFGVRRARLRIDRGWEHAFATLELDVGTLGGPNVRVRRAEASLLYRGETSDDQTPWFVLTGGVTDVPFGAELGESQRDRLFLEQSLASQALFPTPADIGVKAWGAYRFVDYAVALVNGQPLTDSGWPDDLNAPKDVAGRIGARVLPRDDLRLTGGVSFYVGEGFSPGTPATKDTLSWNDDNQNARVDPGEIVGTTGSAAIASQNYSRWGTGLDLGGSFVSPLGVSQLGGELFLAENLDRGVMPNDPITSGADSRQFGVSFFGVQQISKWFALGVRGSFYDPNSNLFEQRAGELHLRNQTYWEISPTAAVTFERARLTFEYDFLIDHLGRDEVGVPTDVANDHFALRLQVDL